LIIDALADYANITGIDLSMNPFAAMLEESNSPEVSSDYSRDERGLSKNIAMAIGN